MQPIRPHRVRTGAVGEQVGVERSGRAWRASVEPARDSPARLGQYVECFDPAFVALTGSEDELEDVAGRYGARFSTPNPGRRCSKARR